MGFPIAALGWAEGRHVVELMYGAEFAASGPYFEWLCLSIALIFLNYGVSVILVPWGHSKLQLKITATCAAVNLALNAVAIPLYGPWGAVATTLAAESLMLVLGLAARRRGGIFWHPVLPIVAPPFVCSLRWHSSSPSYRPPLTAIGGCNSLPVRRSSARACLIFERRVIVETIRRKTPVP